MKKLLLILMTLALSGCGACGPVFIVAPRYVDVSDCLTFEKSFTSSLDGSLIPLPFTGSRLVSLYTDKPELWDEYSGSLHLIDLSWNVDWVKSMTISLGGITVATYTDSRWTTMSWSVDLIPHFSDGDDSRLVITPRFSGKGVKPGKKTVIHTTVTLAACGMDADIIFADLINSDLINSDHSVGEIQ